MTPEVPIVGDEGSGGQRPDNDEIAEPEVMVPDTLLGEDSGDEADEPTDTTGQTASEVVQNTSGQN